MSPGRIIRKARPFWPLVIIACCAALIGAFVVGSYALTTRNNELNDILSRIGDDTYSNCVANETQDSVIVAQLRAAKRRAKASLPAGSAELLYQLQILDDGISALEPPDEPDCQPPEGTQP